MYKLWNEYTQKELYELNNSPEWSNFINYQCALLGIPLLPEYPGEEPTKPEYKGDVTIYSIGGISLLDKEIAEKISTALSGANIADYNYQTGSVKVLKIKNIDAYDYPVVSQTQYYSSTYYETIKNELKPYNEKHKLWEKAMKVYKDIKKQVDNLILDIYELINKEAERVSKENTLNYHYSQYLSLANNDEAIAKTFLAKAFPNLKIEFPEFFSTEAVLTD